MTSTVKYSSTNFKVTLYILWTLDTLVHNLSSATDKKVVLPCIQKMTHEWKRNWSIVAFLVLCFLAWIPFLFQNEESTISIAANITVANTKSSCKNCKVQYIRGDLCMGLSNQRMGLINLVGHSWEHDYTLVLPNMLSHFDWFSQKNISVPISVFYDIQLFRQTLKELNIKYVDRNFKLPANNVVKMGCLHKTFLWNNPARAAIRSRIELSLQPSRSVSAEVNKALDQLENKPYIAIHGRLESDWADYCVKEVLNPTVSHVQRVEECYVTPSDIVSYLLSLNIMPDYPIFIAGGNLTDLKSSLLFSGFTKVYSRVDLLGDVNLPNQLLASIDFELCVQSTEFVGNVYSSFSYEVVARRGMFGRSNYYNFQSKDSERVESIEQARWDVFPRRSTAVDTRVDLLVRNNMYQVSGSFGLRAVSSRLPWKIQGISVILLSDNEAPYMIEHIPNCDKSSCSFKILLPIRVMNQFASFYLMGRLSGGGIIPLGPVQSINSAIK